jgi:hypothetical protein
MIYVGYPVFRFTRLSGQYPDCEADPQLLAAMRTALATALMGDGLDTVYPDEDNTPSSLRGVAVAAVVPCGTTEEQADVTGSLVWESDAPPYPGRRWELGTMLSQWLDRVPFAYGELECLVSMVSLTVLPDNYSHGGSLWPIPGSQDDPGTEAGE